MSCFSFLLARWILYMFLCEDGVGTVGVDVDGMAHPGVLAVHVLLYIEVHGASWCMGVDVLSTNIYITMLGTYYSTIYNGNSEHFCSQKSIIIVSGEEPKSKSNRTEP